MSDASSVVSSSSTLIGDVATMAAKNGRNVQPHRRAVSALGFGASSGRGDCTASDNPFMSPSSPASSTKSPGLGALPSPSAFLMRSNSIPAIPSFKAKEVRLPRPDGCRVVSALELQRDLEGDDANAQSDNCPAVQDTGDVVVLDVRPFVDYSRASVRNAVHVCLPSTLLRRKTFTLDRLVENLPEPDRALVRAKVLECADPSKVKVIIFDNNPQASDETISIGCHGMVCKFLHYEGWANDARPQVGILECGFMRFKEIVPELIVEPCTMAAATTNAAKPPPLNYSRSTSYISTSPQSFPDSPLSSSSPVAKLFKFQLPTRAGCPPPFKMPQHEEISNLESYLSAVNIGEKQFSAEATHICTPGELKSAFPTPTEFKFPPVKSSPTSVDLSSPCRTSLSRGDNKLNFQKRCYMLADVYGNSRFNFVVPQWFQDLVGISKLDIVSQFQKVDLLEKKRLSFCVSNTSNGEKRSDSSEKNHSRDLHEETSTPEKPCCISQWLDSYDPTEDDQSIRISSGVELGVKNRYKDIFPYEHTRVVLKKSSKPRDINSLGDVWDTYINANYLVNPFTKIVVPQSEKCVNVRYIATQAPLPSTISDFYTCILNNNVPIILTLTDEYENGVEKCHKFWAEGTYEGITVKLLEEYTMPILDKSVALDGEIVIRRIQLTHGNHQHFETLQLQIKNWPDLGVLVRPCEVLEIICLKNLILEQLYEKKVFVNDYIPNIIVHCSAGCGRTGTLCTIDSILANLPKFDSIRHEWVERQTCRAGNSEHEALSTKVFDPVIITINNFRKQRISMVQNVNQYLFIYECLLSYFALKLNDDDPSGIDSWHALEEKGGQLDILKHFIDTKIDEKS